MTHKPMPTQAELQDEASAKQVASGVYGRHENGASERKKPYCIELLAMLWAGGGLPLLQNGVTPQYVPGGQLPLQVPSVKQDAQPRQRTLACRTGGGGYGAGGGGSAARAGGAGGRAPRPIEGEPHSSAPAQTNDALQLDGEQLRTSICRASAEPLPLLA
jgi:hypothetical protein